MTEDELNRLEALCERGTPGEWFVGDSNSWRRFCTHREGNFLYPTTQRDGHPDMGGRNREVDLELACAARNALPDLIAEVRRLREGWRPIEEAPRDGTAVLVKTADGYDVAVWAWDENDKPVFMDQGMDRRIDATAYLPLSKLPAPPQDSAG